MKYPSCTDILDSPRFSFGGVARKLRAGLTSYQCDVYYERNEFFVGFKDLVKKLMRISKEAADED